MALAALITGGTFSDRGGGSAVGTTSPSLVEDFEVAGAVTTILRGAVVGAELLAMG